MTVAEISSPQAAGLDPERLANIDRHLQRYIDEGRIAGCVTLVARRGHIAHFEPLGLMDRERQKPFARDTIVRIYSMTKPITSVALMQLYERGLVQLDDPVHRYIPEWRDLRVYVSGNHPNFITRPVERPMTVRDLLTHQSGLTYGFMERTNVDAAYRKLGIGGLERTATLREMVETLAGLPLEFSPGTAWNYSVSTDVCGYLVEVISGQRFDEYLDEHVFRPLGMVDTAFWVPPGKASRFAANYSVAGDGITLLDDPETSAYREPPSFFSGGGGLVSTASDYFRFAQAVLNGGELDGARILGRKTIDLMTINHIPGEKDLADVAVGGQFTETRYTGVGFGLGFSVTLDLARAQLSGTPGEHAWGGAASTAFWIDPAEEFIVIFLTQLMPSTHYNFRRELRAITYAAIVD